jgi:glycine/sarcosine N-methyltransferase
MASIRDYDHLVNERPTVQGPVFYSDHGQRRIVHQVWDWVDERRYTFHLHITRQVDNDWDNQHYVSECRALLRSEQTNTLQKAGFTDIRWLLPEHSGFYQPIVLCRKR